jgi:MFS family permease
MHDDAEYPDARWAWYGVGVLMVAYTFSFIDRYVIALLIQPIKQDFDLSDTQIGLLSGIAFALFYTTLGIPIGRLADHYNRRRIISAGIFIWSMMTGLCGLAQSFLQLFIARIGVGVGEAALSPAAFSLIADSFPPRRIGRALSVYSVGVYFGSGLAFIIGGAVIQLVTNAADITLPLIGTIRAWQLTFVGVGLPGILISLWVFTIREPGRRNLATASGTSIPVREVVRFIWAGRRAYGAHFFGFSLMALAFNAIAIWSPTFLGRAFDFTPSEAGYSLGSIILVFGSTGIIAGGWLADTLAERGRQDATLRVGIIAAVGMTPFAIMAPLMPSASGVLMLYCPLMFFSSFGFGAAAAALQLITPNEMRGQVSAVYLFMINLIGIGLGPFLTGRITDAVFANDAAVGFSIAIVAGSSAPIAALALASGLRAFRAQRAAQV